MNLYWQATAALAWHSTHTTGLVQVVHSHIDCAVHTLAYYLQDYVRALDGDSVSQCYLSCMHYMIPFICPSNGYLSLSSFSGGSSSSSRSVKCWLHSLHHLLLLPLLPLLLLIVSLVVQGRVARWIICWSFSWVANTDNNDCGACRWSRFYLYHRSAPILRNVCVVGCPPAIPSHLLHQLQIALVCVPCSSRGVCAKSVSKTEDMA